jgi:hypothetical protein
MHRTRLLERRTKYVYICMSFYFVRCIRSLLSVCMNCIVQFVHFIYVCYLGTVFIGQSHEIYFLKILKIISERNVCALVVFKVFEKHFAIQFFKNLIICLYKITYYFCKSFWKSSSKFLLGAKFIL